MFNFDPLQAESSAAGRSVASSPCESDEALVTLKGISKQFGENHVLDHIDFTLNPGEAIAIIGPSGTGKSTILRIIAGLLAPDEGEIWVAGQKRIGLIEDSPDPLGVGMVFQQAALFELANGGRKRRVFALPAFQSKVSGDSKARVRRASNGRIARYYRSVSSRAFGRYAQASELR